MKLRVIAVALVVLGAGLVLSTCTANGGSIFYNIENEQKVGSSTLPKYLVIADMAVISSGSYYVAAGAIFSGSGTPSNMAWTPSSDSATTYRPYNAAYNGASMLCNALTLFSSKLYGGFISSSGEHVGLYSAPSSDPSTANWAQVTTLPSYAIGEQASYLQVANNNLFVGGSVVTLTGSTYELDSSPDGSTWTQCALPTLTKPVNGVAYAGTWYYVSTANALYGSTSSTFASPTQITLSPALGSTATPDQINGVFADGSTLYIFTAKSGIYTLAAGGATATLLVAAPVPSTSVYVSFLCMAKPTGSTGTYLVGADGYGYYTLSGTTLTRYSDTSVALYAESVSHIVIDGVNVFMGTNATGLWGAQMDGSGALTTTWTHEQKS